MGFANGCVIEGFLPLRRAWLLWGVVAAGTSCKRPLAPETASAVQDPGRYVLIQVAVEDGWSGRSFYLKETEVTVDEYRDCVADGVCDAPRFAGANCNYNAGNRLRHPVNCLTPEQASSYCKWDSARLPTWAEWTFAAAGGSEDRPYPWGTEKPSCDRVVRATTPVFPRGAFTRTKAYINAANRKLDRSRGCGRGSTWDVGSKPAGESRDGLYDMAGNVAEYTLETGAGVPSEERVWVRGSAWTRRFLYASDSRYESTFGTILYPGAEDWEAYGFRCARDTPAGGGADSVR